MKVLMLTEYFYPYDFGGSEWSTFYLAKGLSKRNFNVDVMTPNFSNLPTEINVEGFKVYRFPFYKKFKNKKELSPLWMNNPFWFAWSSFFVLRYCLKNNIDIIHVQGKYFLSAAILAKLMLRKKVVLTLRDYIILCPLGMCLLKKDKSCSLWHYLVYDLWQYIKIYQSSKNPFYKSLIILSACYARVVNFILRTLVILVDQKIAVSHLTKQIYENSGIKNMKVINNPFNFEKQNPRKRTDEVIFVGRLTPGKGPNVLLEAIPKILKKYPGTTFVFVGDGFLKQSLIQSAKSLNVNSKVRFLGRLSHQKLLSLLSSSKAVVVPSVWPEPFGRVALESLAMLTPPVVSSRMGISKYILDKKWGVVVKPSPEQIAKGVIYTFENFQKIEKAIAGSQTQIKQKFGEQIYDSYAKLYKSIAT